MNLLFILYFSFMNKQKTISLFTLLSILLLNISFVSLVSAAACVDEDGDGYVVISSGVPGMSDSNGNYSNDEWISFFESYKKNSGCDSVNFKKGGEPTRCDALTIQGPSDVLAEGSISGKKVHPGAVDGPNNGIDEDCDGADGTYIQGGGTTDVTGLLDKIINILGYYIVGGVSAIVLLWGGVTYAGAAGDDTKLRKARKAMMGAVVGLIIGITAPSIINFVIEKMIG